MPPRLPWVLVREILSYSPCFGLTLPKLREARASLVDRGSLYNKSLREAAARLSGSRLYIRCSRGGMHLRVLASDALWRNFRQPSNMGVMVSEWTRAAGSASWTVLLVNPCGQMKLYTSPRPQLDGFFGSLSVEGLGQQLPGMPLRWQSYAPLPERPPHKTRWWQLWRTTMNWLEKKCK